MLEELEVRISADFLEALSSLSSKDARAASNTVEDILDESSSSGVAFEHLKGDSSFISLRCTRGVRIIGIIRESVLSLLYVDQHDEAYDWANSRMNSDYRVRTARGDVVDKNRGIGHTLASLADDIPESIRKGLSSCSDIEDVKRLLDNLHPFVAQRIQEVADAVGIPLPAPVSVEKPLTESEELKKALNLPFERWRFFLGKQQRKIKNAPADDANLILWGGPGTGKTVALAHRAAFLNSQEAHRPVVILTMAHYVSEMKNILSCLGCPEIKVLATTSRDRVIGSKEEPYLRRKTSSKNSSKHPVQSLLVDESQQWEAMGRAVGNIKHAGNLIHMTLCCDPFQATKDNFIEIAESSNWKLVKLSNCYRLVDEVGKVCFSLARVMNDERLNLTEKLDPSSWTKFALLGNSPELRKGGIDDFIEFISKLASSVDEKVGALVWPKKGRVKNVESRLPKSCENVDVLRVDRAYGKEWPAGGVYVKSKNNNIGIYALSYLGISRFRDHVTLYSSGNTYEKLSEVIMGEQQTI